MAKGKKKKKLNVFDYEKVLGKKHAKHQYRFDTVRECSEELWAEETDGVYKFLLFHTDRIAAWTRALDPVALRYGIRSSVYSKGTVMIHSKNPKGKQQPLQVFISHFNSIKKMANRYK